MEISPSLRALQHRFMTRELLALSGPCIIALLDDRRKVAYIGAGKSGLRLMVKLLEALKSKLELAPIRRSARLSLLEVDVKPFNKRILEYVYTQRLKAQGYRVINERTIGSYSAVVRTNKDLKAEVALLSRGKRLYTVKVFDSRAEAQVYIESHGLPEMISHAFLGWD